MQWVIYIFGSGLAFFIGAALLLVALIPSIAGARTGSKVVLLAIVGAILVMLSAAPFPLWNYIAFGILLLVWLLTLRSIPRIPGVINLAFALLAFACLVAAMGNELRFQFPGSPASGHSGRLYLFGDSLAAGTTEQTAENWPSLIASSHGVELVNFAVAGAKVGTMARKAQAARLHDGVVLLEIGGNDVLGVTDQAEFERELESLLLVVSGSGRQVVMFELPLPPFHNCYGEVQRRLAAKYDVRLIPKRMLMGVLASPGMTSDSIHLTRAGHRRMAEDVWAALSPAFQGN